MYLSLINIPSPASTIIDLSLTFALLIVILIMAIKHKLAAKFVIIFLSAILLCAISTIVFDLPVFKWSALAICYLFTVFISLLLTDKEKRTLLIHNKKVSKKENALTVNETDELMKNLTIAVEAMSSTKTGALITIERSDDMSEILDKSGTLINAPVTPEIIQTIFYKGTLLHDGATIIRGNTIVKSAVFYQPTQRPLNGKYGSRHRAAIGISETCDAVTIIVSEETGKVSIAYKGELYSVPVANFEKKLKEYYFYE